ncbi:TPA: hypothetical protein HA361_04095 [Candidatus Woesearchaeota archaeon]|nr:hypothetical protein [Candidatus Woesearchaeota archaeon]HII69179.1 hypothetical protein [Candidatus Woesearchaeota archaeon]
MYHALSSLYPRKLKEKYLALLAYTSLSVNPYRFLGFVLFFGLGLGVAGSLFLAILFSFSVLVSIPVIFITFEVLVYTFVQLNADSKGRFVEDVLPDALQLMSSNLRAGMTFDKALLSSNRPEFGPLQKELTLIGKEVVVGKNIEQALLEMTKRIKSDKLEKNVMLIISGIRSGGELASLLSETSLNLRQQKFVEEKVKSTVMMYTMFIVAAISIGSPMLFALSSFLVQIITGILSTVDIPASGGGGFSFADIHIDLGFIQFFSVMMLVTSSFMGALTIGMIMKGKPREGLRYAPFFVILSLGIYFGVRYFLGGFFEGLFGL